MVTTEKQGLHGTHAGKGGTQELKQGSRGSVSPWLRGPALPVWDVWVAGSVPGRGQPYCLASCS